MLLLFTCILHPTVKYIVLFFSSFCYIIRVEAKLFFFYKNYIFPQTSSPHHGLSYFHLNDVLVDVVPIVLAWHTVIDVVLTQVMLTAERKNKQTWHLAAVLVQQNSKHGSASANDCLAEFIPRGSVESAEKEHQSDFSFFLDEHHPDKSHWCLR